MNKNTSVAYIPVSN